MNSVAISQVVIPGVVSALLFLVFTYLHEQSRQAYFRAWQLAWAAYSLHYGLDAFSFYSAASPLTYFCGSRLLFAMALCIFISARLMGGSYRFRWFDAAVGAVGVVLSYLSLRGHMVDGSFQPDAQPTLRLGLALAAILLYSSAAFYINGHKRGSLAFQVLGLALALWAALMGIGQLHNQWGEKLGSAGSLFGPVPQMLLGIAMVMVLFENQRNAVQENTLALSTLGVDPGRVLDAKELVPSMASILERLVAPLPTRRAIIYISRQWRRVLPSVQRGFSMELLEKLQSHGAGEYLSELAYRRGGFITFRKVGELEEPLPAFPGARFEQFKKVLSDENIRNLTAVSLQTREHNFGVILFPHAERKMFGSSNLRLLIGLALQIGLTLENYVIMHDAQRRTKEYELLTEIGQAISSRLDQDEIL